MAQQHYIRDWEEMATLDSRWAILSDPTKIYGKWDNEEFFNTGKKEIDQVISRLKSHDIPLRYGKALDFGCGIGRLTKGLAGYYDHVTGVDLSSEMISQATSLHAGNSHLEFIQKSSPPLDCFQDRSFDLVFTSITLQHIPDHALIRQYLQEFMRILTPGGILYFHLPSTANYTKPKEIALRFRGRLFFVLKRLGVHQRFIFEKLKIKPYMHMSHLPSAEILPLFSSTGTVLKVFDDHSLHTAYVVQKSS